MSTLGRKACGVLILAILLALATAANAQQANKVIRIGYLASQNAQHETARVEGIRLALKQLGYSEGKNIVFHYRYSDGKTDRADQLAAELVHLQVDIIVVAGGLHWSKAAKDATRTIPIVMAGVGNDPVEAGLIESLARPGGNLTGLTGLGGKLGGKRLEYLKAAVPKITRLAVLHHPATPANVVEIKEELPSAARTLKLDLHTWALTPADRIDAIFGALMKERPDALYAAGGPLINANQDRIVSFAMKNRLPSVYDGSDATYAGGFMSYGADLADTYQRVASYIDRILKGAKPGDLPVEQPTKFELAVNLKTAKQIGLSIPPSVLAQADRVIR